MAPTSSWTRKLAPLVVLSCTRNTYAAPSTNYAYEYGAEDLHKTTTTDTSIQAQDDNTHIAQQLQTFIDANSTCTDLFPDLKNDTVRQNGGYNKLMLVILDGTFLSFFGADRFYMGSELNSARLAPV